LEINFFAFLFMSLHLLQYPRAQTNSNFIQEVRLDSIVCDTSDFKKEWTTGELEEVAEEIESSPAPMIVECVDKQEGLYQVLFGIKYFIAANLLQLETLPALVLQSQHSTVERFLGSSIFNWEHLDEIECAKAYEWLRTVCHYTVEQIAAMRKISRPVIGNQLRLLKLPRSIQRYLQLGRLSKSHCLLLLKLPDAKRQCALAEKVVDGMYSVRSVKEMIEKELPTPALSTKSKPLNITVDKTSIAISFENDKERERLLAYLRDFT
jgi:ParB family transcriptional regulator, chromosome partitioning protein